MTTHIQFHRSNIPGATPDVSYMFVGEPAVNTYDKKLWVKGPSGDLITFIDGKTGERVAGSNKEIQYKAESGFSASSKLVFDGHGLSADGATFDNDIIINGILVGTGSGSNSNLNTVVGRDALESNTSGLQNVAVGAEALQKNTTGVSNTAVGYRAGENITTGGGNSAVGQGALQNGTTGSYNTAIGQRALDSNTRGEDNTAVGMQSLFNSTEGVKNTAVGKWSLYSSQHDVVARAGDETNWANCNTAVGYQSAYLGKTVDYNTAVGFRSLYNTDGHSNTAIGASAGAGIYSGSKNTALGASAGQLSNRISGHNNTFLGHASEPSSITVSNEITLGDRNVDTIRTGNDGFSISTTHGISAEGATFGGDVILQGNVLLPDDGYIGINGDTEKISFNGSGIGSSSIDIQGSIIDFGNGSGCELRSHSDQDTSLKFVHQHHGTFKDSLQLKQGGWVGVQVNPIDVNVAGATFHGGGATFGGNIILTDDAFIGAGGGDDRIIFDSNGNDITMATNTVFINNALAHNGDSDTKMDFTENNINLLAGGVTFASGHVNQFHLPLGLSADAGATFEGNVTLRGPGDVHLTINADTDNSGENDNPMIKLVQDGTNGAVTHIGMNGDAGQNYTNSLDNSFFIEGLGSIPIQFANNNTARMTIAHTTGKVGIQMEVPRESLEVRGNIMSNAGISGATFSVGSNIEFAGDADTKINFNTNNINLHAGGVTFASGHVNQLVLPLGVSADAGATFAGDVETFGNIYIPDDGYIGIRGDTERISFNGSGVGSSSIDIQGSIIDFGNGSGSELRSHGDIDTSLKFIDNFHGAGSDGLQLRQSGRVGVQVNPWDVSVHGVTFANGGATFSSSIEFSDGTTFGSTQTEIIGVAVDNGTQVLTTGKKGHRILPYDCEVTEWRINSRDSGGITWDVNWCDWDAYPTTASVGGSGLPIINSNTTAGYSGSDTSINWTKKTFNAGDVLEFEVDTVDSMTNCTLSLKIRRNG